MTVSGSVAVGYRQGTIEGEAKRTWKGINLCRQVFGFQVIK